MGRSTWVELGVSTEDLRWPAIYDDDQPPHVTMAYLGANRTEALFRDTVEAVELWMSFRMVQLGQLKLDVTGYDLFAGNTTVLRLNHEALKEHQSQLVWCLEEAKVKVSTDYPFTPHVTISKRRSYLMPVGVQNMSLMIDEIRVCHKGIIKSWKVRRDGGS